MFAGTIQPIKTVISWTYGEPTWIPVVDMNIARDYRHGTVTDGISSIWVVGGCDPDECWPDGFIEQYSVTDNTWTRLNGVPDLEKGFYNVDVASFWQGYIYVIFSKGDVLDRVIIPGFHVYNTLTGEWQFDSTELMLPVYAAMSTIVPET